MKMKRTLLLLVMLSLPAASHAGTMKSGFVWDVHDVTLERRGADSLYCHVALDILEDGVANRCAVVLRPYVVLDGEKRYVRPVSFYRLDNRGHRIRVRSDGMPASGDLGELDRVCGLSRGTLSLEGVVAGPGDADSVCVYVDVTEMRAKDRVTYEETRLVAVFTPTPPPDFYPDFPLLYVDDKDRYNFDRHVTVPLRVAFEDGKDVFKVSYDTNEGSVYEFMRQVAPIVSSSHTKVSEITLSGYCGIEGAASANLRRTQQRLSSVYSYLKGKGVFKKKAVKLDPVGEDWKMLQDWYATTSWHYDRSLNDIIFGPASKDSKERNLKSAVTFWQYMEDNLFPEMERFECLLAYSHLGYRSDDERWEAYNEDRRLLSPYDYSCLLKSLNAWSQGWYDVVFDFAEQYPLCKEALVDALAAMLYLGRLNQASDYFRYLSGPYAAYYRAVWYMYSDRLQEAHDEAAGLDTSLNPAFRSLVDKIAVVYDWKQSVAPWDKRIIKKRAE